MSRTRILPGVSGDGLHAPVVGTSGGGCRTASGDPGFLRLPVGGENGGARAGTSATRGETRDLLAGERAWAALWTSLARVRQEARP
jgi:hypothetical protein